MMSISILGMIHMQADKLILSKFLPLGMFGYYSFAYGLVGKPSFMTGAISQAVFPSFSVLASAGEGRTLKAQYKKFQNVICLSTAPLFAAIPFGALPLFTYIFNSEVAQTLLLPVTFLAIGFYMNGTLTMPYIFSLAVGKPDIATRFNFLALFIVLPVTVLLIYFFGLAGAGFSWVFYHLVSYSYAIPRICLECFGSSPSEWYAHVVKILALGIVTYGASWAVLNVLGSYTPIALALAYLSASAIFLLGNYLMSNDELQETLYQLRQGLRVLLRY
jgi:O-antigen/teichoic acid export membrane protein